MNLEKNWFKRSHLLIAACGILFLVFAYTLERSQFWVLLSYYTLAFYLCWKIIETLKDKPRVLFYIGLGFRLLFLFAIPNLSQDFYRFIWDGRLLLQGLNPYLSMPLQFMEAENFNIVNQSQELYAGMGALNGSHFTNYPPVNQLCFAIAALFTGKSILGSAIVFRAIIIFSDIGILYFGKKILKHLKLPTHRIFWYFLNPFIIIEMTGNLHFEPLMLFFVIWALYMLLSKKWLWAAVILGLSVSVKLIPLLLLPLFFQWFVKNDLKPIKGFLKLSGFYLICLLTVALTFLPFLSGDFVTNFGASILLWFQNFEFNASVYYIIRWIGFQTIGWNIIETVGKILPLIVIAFLLGMTFFRKNRDFKSLITALLFGISFYYLFSTTVHPWYIALPLLLSIFTKYRFPLVWSLVVVLTYSAYPASGYSENLWLVALEYGLVIGVFVWEVFFRNWKLEARG